MTDRNVALCQPFSHILVQLEQSHAVRDRRPAFADFFRDVFLLQPELFRETRERRYHKSSSSETVRGTDVWMSLLI